MKKIKVFLLLLLFSFSIKDTNALVSRKAITGLQCWLQLGMIVDQGIEFIPKVKEYKIWPKPELTIQKPKDIQFNPPLDSNYTVYVPGLVNNIFASSLGQSESFISIVASGALRIKSLQNSIARLSGLPSDSNELKKLMAKEALVVLAEKISENIIANFLNISAKKNKISKRILKIILFTGIAAGGTHLRKLLSSDNLKDFLPHYKTIAFDRLVENIVIETLAVFIEHFIIDSSLQEMHEKLHKKHQNILSIQLSNHLARLEKQNLKHQIDVSNQISNGLENIKKRNITKKPNNQNILEK